MTTRDLLHFLRCWISDPIGIGAIAPSSTALARLITSEITCRSGRVIELGAGTGAFTRALRARGVREANLVLVEQNANFETLLRLRFPLAQVLRMDAAHLGDWARDEPVRAGAVVSGLPLLNLTPAQVSAILAGAFSCLDDQGAFYQFTYGMGCPVPKRFLDELGLEATRIGRALRNLPPAAVYRIRRSSVPTARLA